MTPDGSQSPLVALALDPFGSLYCGDKEMAFLLEPPLGFQRLMMPTLSPRGKA